MNVINASPLSFPFPIPIPGGGGNKDVTSLGIVNVKFYGAAGDGVTDDAPAIAKAVAAVGGNGILFFPNGTYLLNTSYPSGFTAIDNCNIVVTNANGLRILGESKGGVTLTTGNSANYTDILLIGNSKNVEIANINFVGNNTGLAAGNNNGAIAMYSCRWLEIHDCETSVFQGSHFVGDWLFNVQVERCQFSIPSAASAFDVAFIQDFTVRDCDMVGGGAASQGFQHIYDTPNASSANNQTGQALTNGISNNIRIEDNRISSFQSGIVLADCTDILVEGNNIFSNWSSSNPNYWGVLIESTQASIAMTDIRIKDNDIYQNGSGSGIAHSGAAIRIDPAGNGTIDVTISDNSIFDNQTDGISIANSGVSLKAVRNRFFNKNNTNQATQIYQAGLLANNPYPDKTSIIKDNFGYNPQGWTGLVSNPAIPAGTGAANSVTNINPYPVMVYQNGGSGLHIVSGKDGTDFAVVGGAQSMFLLEPQDKVYFATAAPSGWNWYGM